MTDIRKGQAPAVLSRNTFHERFMQSFMDPAFQAEEEAISRVEQIAWEAYKEGRKAPVTRKAGRGYADPDYDLSVEWLDAKSRINKAAAAWKKPSTPSRVLLICGSSRNDGTCPGEISKTFRMVEWAQKVLKKEKMETDVLDLSLLTSSYHLNIHPCKAVYRPPCRCATGPAVVTRTIRWARPATG